MLRYRSLSREYSQTSVFFNLPVDMVIRQRILHLDRKYESKMTWQCSYITQSSVLSSIRLLFKKYAIINCSVCRSITQAPMWNR